MRRVDTTASRSRSSASRASTASFSNTTTSDPARSIRCDTSPKIASSFDTEGRCLGGPSPRGLDELDVTVQGKDVLVRYQRFRIGTPKKEPLG